jgi:hypothetical protein
MTCGKVGRCAEARDNMNLLESHSCKRYEAAAVPEALAGLVTIQLMGRVGMRAMVENKEGLIYDNRSYDLVFGGRRKDKRAG